MVHILALWSWENFFEFRAELLEKLVFLDLLGTSALVLRDGGSRVNEDSSAIPRERTVYRTLELN